MQQRTLDGRQADLSDEDWATDLERHHAYHDAYDMALQLARERGQVTADDLAAALPRLAKGDRSVFGAVFTALVRAGLLTPAGRARTVRKEGHRRVVQVYDFTEKCPP